MCRPEVIIGTTCRVMLQAIAQYVLLCNYTVSLFWVLSSCSVGALYHPEAALHGLPQNLITFFPPL